MIFFRAIEVIIAILVSMFFVTQIIIPAYRKTLMFPYFRKQGKLEKEEVQLNQRDVESNLEYKIEKRKEEK